MNKEKKKKKTNQKKECFPRGEQLRLKNGLIKPIPKRSKRWFKPKIEQHKAKKKCISVCIFYRLVRLLVCSLCVFFGYRIVLGSFAYDSCTYTVCHMEFKFRREKKIYEKQQRTSIFCWQR